MTAVNSRLLSGIGVFIAVVDTGNFARAGVALSLTTSGVSRAIARLEERLRVRLFHRSTHAVTLTDEGRTFHDRVLPLLTGLEQAAGALAGTAAHVVGRLRAGVDPFFAQWVLAPRLDEFLAAHPALSVDLIVQDTLSDPAADAMDVLVRFGEPRASSWVARRLADVRVLTVAAPRYLEQHAAPRHPQELKTHNCLQFRDPATGRPFDWEFHRPGEVVQVETHGTLFVNDPASMHAVCMAGGGIAQMLEPAARDLITDGRLIELFDDWPGETFPLFATFPSRRQAPAKVRAFVEYCVRLLTQSQIHPRASAAPRRAPPRRGATPPRRPRNRSTPR